MQRLLVTGSLAYDYILRYPGRLQDNLSQLYEHDRCNITLQAESLGRYFGGCGGNLAYTLALMGTNPRLVSLAGSDAECYREHLVQAGVDFAGVKLLGDRLTATCVILTDRSQNRVIGFYGGATDQASTLDLKDHIDETIFACIIAPDDGPAMLVFAESCRLAGLPFIFDFGSQAAGLTGEQLKTGVAGAQATMCNEYEFSIFQAKTGWTLDELHERVPLVVVTRGEHGSVIYERGQPPLAVAATPLRSPVVDSTGAGDAFRAGFGLGWLHGLPWERCAQLGSTAAAFVLESPGTQGHRFTRRELLERCQQTCALDAIFS